MTINRTQALFAAVILGFGLVSCSKETEIKYQQDAFNPRDILVEKGDKSFTALNNISSFDFSRQLIINDENTAAENRITNLVLSTTCRPLSSATSSTLTSNWPNPGKINVLDILPMDILLHRSKEPVYCEITYTSTNAFNSTNTGKVSQIKIANMDSFSNLAASHPLMQPQVAWSLIADGTLVPLENAISTIVCDDFSYSAQDLFPSASKDNVLAPQVYSEQTLNSTLQTCRAVFKNKDRVALSPVFQLALPVAAPTVSHAFSVRNAGHPYVDETHGINYTLTNPNPYPLRIHVNADGKIFLVRIAVLAGGNYVPSTVNEFPVAWHFNGQAISLTSQTPLVLPPRSTSTLRVNVSGAIDCTTYIGNNAGLLGTNSDLNEDVVFTYYDSENTAQLVTSPYIGQQYTSPSRLKNWDLSLHLTPQSEVGGLVHWMRWGSAFNVPATNNPNHIGCQRTR